EGLGIDHTNVVVINDKFYLKLSADKEFTILEEKNEYQLQFKGITVAQCRLYRDNKWRTTISPVGIAEATKSVNHILKYPMCVDNRYDGAQAAGSIESCLQGIRENRYVRFDLYYYAPEDIVKSFGYQKYTKENKKLLLNALNNNTSLRFIDLSLAMTEV